YAHGRGVIQRDIKPSNGRIASDGSVKIMDFGIARLQTADITGSGAIVGTPTYMAPEQITNGPITPATDLFAVGCLLYELLSYRKPFEGETVHGVLYQVLTTDPKPLRAIVPSLPLALDRAVAKALNKVPEDRYETARHMQSALSSIRAALSGASETTALLAPRWTPIPAAALRLVTHAPLKWRAAVLTALMVTALVLLYVSRSPSPVAAPLSTDATATLDQLLAYPLPTGLNGALTAQRDSALAARDRAHRAGAMKNNVPSLLLAETVLQNAERAVRAGDQAHAASGYLSAVTQYGKAQHEADGIRREAQLAIARATPVVHALATRPEAGRAGTSLARAESLFVAMDYTLAKLAALDAEQVGVAAGVAPPSPQPPDPRAGHRILEVASRQLQLVTLELHAVYLPDAVPQRDPQAVPDHPPVRHLIPELRRAVAPHHDVADLVLALGLPLPLEAGVPGSGLGGEPGGGPESEQQQEGSGAAQHNGERYVPPKGVPQVPAGR